MKALLVLLLAAAAVEVWRRRCRRCGRIVPYRERREGPYVLEDGRRLCLACIVELAEPAPAVVPW